MKKLHYKDPLAAAYMAREFGVSYTKSVDAKWKNRRTGHGESGDFYEIHFGYFEKLDKIYIHPDSYYVFEPKAGDLVCAANYFCEEHSGCVRIKEVREMDRNGNKGPFLYFLTQISADEEFFVDWFVPEDFHRLKVIERDGKTFFWPESE